MRSADTGILAENFGADIRGGLDVRRAPASVADGSVQTAAAVAEGPPIKIVNPGLELGKPLAAGGGIDSEPDQDTIPDDQSTDADIGVGEQRTGYINSDGDEDWYRINLTRGDVYEFSLEGSGGEGALADPLLRLYDSEGREIASSDDDGEGLNSLLTYVAEQTGEYYLSAEAYSDRTGRYTLSASETELPNVLRSIDWGTKVEPTTISVYFAEEGETFDGETSLGWNNYEMDQAMLAFQQIANVANVEFVRTGDRDAADFKLVTTNSDFFLGYFNPPGERNEGVGVFARNGFGWDQQGQGGLDQGGYGFITMIHEFGHGMGLAHPHDDGGTSTVMVGVTGPFDSYGLFDLNQGVFTTMSYNDGWQTGPNGVDFDTAAYGWQGTMMALDVAILQKKYGANTDFHSGGDTYVLAAENAPGTMYECIWDTGGVDQITYSGSDDAVINLKPATIRYAEGGGGYVSWVDGVIGGYTIARGVRIENASSGGGDDRLTGNGGDNALEAGAGADTLDGRQGNDQLWGGGGDDVFAFTTYERRAGTVMDLEEGDTVSLRALDAVRGEPGNQRFTLVDQFGDQAGEAVVSYRGGADRTRLDLDLDGNGRADISIYFEGDVRDFLQLQL